MNQSPLFLFLSLGHFSSFSDAIVSSDELSLMRHSIAKLKCQDTTPEKN